MEFLLELLFDIILEGSIEVGSGKKVPFIIRILAGGIVLAIFLGLSGVLIYAGYEMFLMDSKVGATIFFGMGMFLILGGTLSIRKMFCKKKENSNKK